MTVVVYPTLGPHIITVPQYLCVKNTHTKLFFLHYVAFIYINYNFISLISPYLIFIELLQPKVPAMGHLNNSITSKQIHCKRIMFDILGSL